MFSVLSPKVKADPTPTTTSASPFTRTGATYIVWPNGHDDTKDIQAAFNLAVAHPGSTVQLEKGTYYISQITVYGFQGRFVGMGQGLTTIQALPNLPSPSAAVNSPTAPPFWTQLPGPANPWPDLFTFVGGLFGISGMTLSDPYANPVQSWYEFSTAVTWLFAAILITGTQASATTDHVTVVGTTNAEGYNIANGILYLGFLLPTGWTDPVADLILVSGTFSVTNCVFNTVESGPWVARVVNAKVTMSDNTLINNGIPIGFFDLSNSKLLISGNRDSNVPDTFAIEGGQSFSGLMPSTVYITDNYFQVNQGANAIVLGDYGTPSTLNAVITGNVIQTDTGSGYVPTDPADFSVIVSYSLESVVVSQNTILSGGSAGVYLYGGPGVVSGNTILGSYYGVYLDSANGVHVTGNMIKNSAQYGIAITDGSSNNRMVGNVVKNSGVDDLYWDGTGAGNVWIANQYRTSSPPGLG
jgi:parallel beta-helix repeat protein